ncbi:3'-5' exonuclease [Streptomyces luteireticuli]|uniref:3'-5' exonuclease n=1 Tax=Streptomyces luteireticuli TaxID=173858 RepID=UPI0031D95C61
MALYRPDEAVAMRPLSPRQQAAITARRTCTVCTTVGTTVLPERRGPWLPGPGRVCTNCDRALEEQHRRTCRRCGTEFQQSDSVTGGQCEACTERVRQAEAVARRLALRHCPGCQMQTATREEIAAADPLDVALDYPVTCHRCRTAEQERQTEARRQEERDRWDELGPVRRWARQVLAAPHQFAILDTETTGLAPDAKIVEISITDGAGRTLLDTLVNPQAVIPEDALGIHGITDDMVRDAPIFGQVLPRITQALSGRRVIIYNRAYDTGRLVYELDRHHRATTPTLPGISLPSEEYHPAAVAWMDAQEWDQCAMEAYAVHVGEWSPYFDGWKWQPLGGGHRALGDCRTVVRRLSEIAEAPDPL